MISRSKYSTVSGGSSFRGGADSVWMDGSCIASSHCDQSFKASYIDILAGLGSAKNVVPQEDLAPFQDVGSSRASSRNLELWMMHWVEQVPDSFVIGSTWADLRLQPPQRRVVPKNTTDFVEASQSKRRATLDVHIRELAGAKRKKPVAVIEFDGRRTRHTAMRRYS